MKRQWSELKIHFWTLRLGALNGVHTDLFTYSFMNKYVKRRMSTLIESFLDFYQLLTVWYNWITGWPFTSYKCIILYATTKEDGIYGLIWALQYFSQFNQSINQSIYIAFFTIKLNKLNKKGTEILFCDSVNSEKAGTPHLVHYVWGLLDNRPHMKRLLNMSWIGSRLTKEIKPNTSKFISIHLHL